MGLYGLHARFFKFDEGCSIDDCRPGVLTTTPESVTTTAESVTTTPESATTTAESVTTTPDTSTTTPPHAFHRFLATSSYVQC